MSARKLSIVRRTTLRSFGRAGAASGITAALDAATLALGAPEEDEDDAVGDAPRLSPPERVHATAIVADAAHKRQTRDDRTIISRLPRRGATEEKRARTPSSGPTRC